MLNGISRHKFQDMSQIVRLEGKLREVFQKQKRKFKMAFAMKGGRGLAYHKRIQKNDLFKNHLESFPDCQNVFCTQFGLYTGYVKMYYISRERLFTENSLINASIQEFQLKYCLNLTKSKKHNHPQPGQIHNIHMQKSTDSQWWFDNLYKVS